MSGEDLVQAFGKIGLVPDAGGSWFLVKRLGLARALGAAMLGDKTSAKDAKEFGMIWDVAAEGEDCVQAAMKPNATKGSWNRPSPPARPLAGLAGLPPRTWSASVRPS